MSLADELLADLEEIAEEGEDEELNDGDINDEIEDIDEMEIDTKMDSVRNIAKLRHGDEVSLNDCCFVKKDNWWPTTKNTILKDIRIHRLIKIQTCL